MCHQFNCGCERHAYADGGHYHYEGCDYHGNLPRRFPTKEETIREMEDYLKQLQAEVKGVEEHLTEMKKGS